MDAQKRKQLAAFFELLDKWQKAEDADLLARGWVKLYGGRRVLGVFVPVAVAREMGVLCGGVCRVRFPFT